MIVPRRAAASIEASVETIVFGAVTAALMRPAREPRDTKPPTARRPESDSAQERWPILAGRPEKSEPSSRTALLPTRRDADPPSAGGAGPRHPSRDVSGRRGPPRRGRPPPERHQHCPPASGRPRASRGPAEGVGREWLPPALRRVAESLAVRMAGCVAQRTGRPPSGEGRTLSAPRAHRWGHLGDGISRRMGIPRSRGAGRRGVGPKDQPHPGPRRGTRGRATGALAGVGAETSADAARYPDRPSAPREPDGHPGRDRPAGAHID